MEYPPERAPFQYNLQKQTSELSLVTPPTVQTLTPLQLAADRVQVNKERQKRVQQKFSILDEVRDIMEAHKKRGKLYNSLTTHERKDFDELRKMKPSQSHREWLVAKFTDVDIDYPSKFNTLEVGFYHYYLNY